MNLETCNKRPACLWRDNRDIGAGIILIAAVCAAVLVVHWPALSAKALSFDDSDYFTDNVLVQNPGWASAKRFLIEVRSPSTVKGYYQPLAMISLMFDYVLGGRENNLIPFHRTSLILHAANTALIIVLLYLLFGQIWVAAGVGLLFGVHPMTVEPIPWVGERKTLLAAFFSLWSLIFYVRYAQKSQKIYCLASFVTYLLALMSKPTSTPLPLVMLLMDYWPLRRLNRRAIFEKLPFFVIGGVSAVITVISQGSAGGAAMPNRFGPERIPLILTHNIIFYLYKIIWPVRLSSHYPVLEPLNLSQPMVLAGVVGTCLLILLLVLSLRRTRAALTGWLIFFVAILPTMGVIGFTVVIAADKFAYLPSIGLLMILTSFLGWLCGGKSARRCAVVMTAVLVLGAAESVATRRYLSYWQDSVGLYEYMAGLSPDSIEVQNGLGYALHAQGRNEESLPHFYKALQVNPNDADTHNRLATALQLQGKLDEAIEHYRIALLLKPDYEQIYNNLGGAYLAQNRLDEATDCFRKALRIRPEYADAHNNIGIVLARQGKLEEAVSEFSQAMRLKPGHVKACDNLRQILQIDPNCSAAREALQAIKGTK